MTHWRYELRSPSIDECAVVSPVIDGDAWAELEGFSSIGADSFIATPSTDRRFAFPENTVPQVHRLPRSRTSFRSRVLMYSRAAPRPFRHRRIAFSDVSCSSYSSSIQFHLSYGPASLASSGAVGSRQDEDGKKTHKPRRFPCRPSRGQNGN